MKSVLIPLPDRNFDTTEVAVPWQHLMQAGVEAVFATERGAIAQCDPLLLTGVVFGQLGADAEATQAYQRMIGSAAFRQPLLWAAIDVNQFDALLLPGGRAPGMR